MSGVPVIIVFRINKVGMEKMKKNNKGKLKNKKQVLNSCDKHHDFYMYSVTGLY